MDRTWAKNHNITLTTFTPTSGNVYTHQKNTCQQSQLPPTSFMNWKRKRTELNKMCNQQNFLKGGTFRRANNFLHLNSLWSIWYGIVLTLFQGYLALHGTYRFLGCSLISWKSEPVTELNLQILLSGVVFILLPVFFITAVFKIGNFANDGVKLTTGMYWCDCSLQNGSNSFREVTGNNFLHTAAVNGGPTSSFIHILIALCLLLPRLLLEAGIIENGFLPLENIWQTELNFMNIYRQKLPSISITNFETYRNNTHVDLNLNENTVEYYNTTMFTDVTAIIPTENEVNSNGSYLSGLFELDSFDEPPSNNWNHVFKPLENGNISKVLHNLLYDSVAKTNNYQDNFINTSKFERTETREFDSNNNNNNTAEIESFNIERIFGSFEFESNASIVLNWSTVPSTLISIKVSNLTNNNTINESNKNDSKKLTNSIIDLNINLLKPTLSSILEVNTRDVSSTTKISPSIELKESRNLTESNIAYSDNLLHKTKTHYYSKMSRKKHKGYKNRHRYGKQPEQQIFPVYKNITNGTIILEYSTDGIKSVTVKTLINNNTSTSKDSNIHIVRTEKLPEIVPSTPITGDSKIIAIKTKFLKRLKRELITRIKNIFKEIKSNAEYWTTTTEQSAINKSNKNEVNEHKANILAGFAGYLQLLFGIERAINVEIFNHSPSAEFINLIIALTVWCIRYPSVFWVTSKSFAIVFSLQIIASAIDILFTYAGISILYKYQMYSQFQFITSPELLLNKTIIFSLFLITVLLNLTSSMIMYLHGYVRLSAKIRERSVISLKSNNIWIYLAHLLSCGYILLLAIVKAPILNDFSTIYHQRTDRLVFISAVVCVLHLLLWILIWLCLSVKQDWKFKIGAVNVYNMLDKDVSQKQRQRSCHHRIYLPSELTARRFQASSNNSENSYINSKLNNFERSCDLDTKSTENCGKATVKSGNDINPSDKSKDINLKKQCKKYDLSHINAANYCEKKENNPTLLKVTFKGIQYISNSELNEHSTEQIMDCVLHHDNNKRKSVYSATNFIITSNSNSDNYNDNNNDGREYESLRSNSLTKIATKTFKKEQDIISNNGDIRRFYFNKHCNESSLTSQEMSSMIIATDNNFHPQNNRNNYIPITDDNVSEEGKLLDYVRNESITYASATEVESPLPPPPSGVYSADLDVTANIHLSNQFKDLSGIIVANNGDNGYPSNGKPVTVTVHTYDTHINFNSSPRYFRRNEINMPQELLTPRSETTSMGTSSTTSPPDRPSSESSSGVHSGEERENEMAIRPKTFTKCIAKLQPPSILEEPYDRCTNMQMSSFIVSSMATNSCSTLPLQRSLIDHQFDYSQHCRTMPLP